MEFLYTDGTKLGLRSFVAILVSFFLFFYLHFTMILLKKYFYNFRNAKQLRWHCTEKGSTMLS